MSESKNGFYELSLHREQFTDKLVGLFNNANELGSEFSQYAVESRELADEIFDKYIREQYLITGFLNEVEEQDWELDSDDIKHILKLDFDYVRKQYQTTSVTDGIPKEKI